MQEVASFVSLPEVNKKKKKGMRKNTLDSFLGFIFTFCCCSNSLYLMLLSDKWSGEGHTVYKKHRLSIWSDKQKPGVCCSLQRAKIQHWSQLCNPAGKGICYAHLSVRISSKGTYCNYRAHIFLTRANAVTLDMSLKDFLTSWGPINCWLPDVGRLIEAADNTPQSH